MYSALQICTDVSINTTGTTPHSKSAWSYRPGYETADELTRQTGQHHPPPSELVDHVCAPEGKQHIRVCQASIDDRLRPRIRNSNSSQNNHQIISYECGTGSLGQDRAAGDDPRPPPVALGPEQRCPAAVALLALEGQRALNLVHFEIDQRIALIAAAVVVQQDLARFRYLAFGHQPSRTLGYEPGECNGDYGGKHLEEADASPAPVALDREGAEGYPRGDESSLLYTSG